MKCPYQDIGCWWIDDESHECEARSRSDCRHEPQEESEKKHQDEVGEDD
jgi:hypothetical protein